jgi:hypothetical protein
VKSCWYGKKRFYPVSSATSWLHVDPPLCWYGGFCCWSWKVCRRPPPILHSLFQETSESEYLDYSHINIIFTDLLSNRRLRNCYFSVTLKNTHQLHFSRKKVQLHFSNRKVQLVAVALFFKLRLHFSEWLRNNYFSGDWDIDKPLYLLFEPTYTLKMVNVWCASVVYNFYRWPHSSFIVWNRIGHICMLFLKNHHDVYINLYENRNISAYKT